MLIYLEAKLTTKNFKHFFQNSLLSFFCLLIDIVTKLERQQFDN